MMRNHLHAGASAHAVVQRLFQQHCSNFSVPQCSLHQLLLGLLHCFAWAGSASLNVAHHVPTKELGVQVGTAAVFLAGDRLSKCHSGKRALASLQLASDILMKWLFPDTCNFGRSSAGALCALTGVLCAQGLLLLKARAHTKQGRQIGRLLARPQRALFGQRNCRPALWSNKLGPLMSFFICNYWQYKVQGLMSPCMRLRLTQRSCYISGLGPADMLEKQVWFDLQNLELLAAHSACGNTFCACRDHTSRALQCTGTQFSGEATSGTWVF